MLDSRLAPNMAVTEAGCDLTYCKMRGIVAVLTGELLKTSINPVIPAAPVLYLLVLMQGKQLLSQAWMQSAFVSALLLYKHRI